MNKLSMKSISGLMAGAFIALVVALVFVSPRIREEIPVVDEPVLPAYDLKLSMVQNRMTDPDYVETLKQMGAERREIVAEAHRVRDALGGLVEHAAAELVAEHHPDVADEKMVESLKDQLDRNQLEARARSYPQWDALENDLLSFENELAEFQMRVAALIRERMIEQYEARDLAMAAAGISPEPVKDPPIIQRMTDDMRATQEAIINNPELVVITNVPTGKSLAIPPVPDRRPVGTGAQQ